MGFILVLLAQKQQPTKETLAHSAWECKYHVVFIHKMKVIAQSSVDAWCVVRGNWERERGAAEDGGARAPVGANISRDESSLQIDLSDLYSTVTASP